MPETMVDTFTNLTWLKFYKIFKVGIIPILKTKKPRLKTVPIFSLKLYGKQSKDLGFKPRPA